jgi:hypothetical protein
VTGGRSPSVPPRGCVMGPVQGLPPHCVGVGQGFPVPVVATIHGHHTVNQTAITL